MLFFEIWSGSFELCKKYCNSGKSWYFSLMLFSLLAHFLLSSMLSSGWIITCHIMFSTQKLVFKVVIVVPASPFSAFAAPALKKENMQFSSDGQVWQVPAKFEYLQNPSTHLTVNKMLSTRWLKFKFEYLQNISIHCTCSLNVFRKIFNSFTIKFKVKV